MLDSAKDFATQVVDGQARRPKQPAAAEEPAAPPPTDDKAAQADIAPVEVQSLAKMEGEKIAVDALPMVEVPQNVTIINNVTNVTNVTNITNNTTSVTNNNTVINNNGGGGQGGGEAGQQLHQLGLYLPDRRQPGDLEPGPGFRPHPRQR